MEKTKNNYYIKKEETRQEAIFWQIKASKNNYSWGEIAYYSNYFYNKAKRYGLIKEFEENAII